MNAPPTSKTKLYRIGDAEDDLFSDAMDRAVSVYHSVMHGAMRNAERAGEGNTMDGERVVRRALAAGFKGYLEEMQPVETSGRSVAGLIHDGNEVGQKFPVQPVLGTDREISDDRLKWLIRQEDELASRRAFIELWERRGSPMDQKS